MSETRRKFDREVREGAVRLVHETGRPIAQIARDLGINPGTLANWVERDRDAEQGRRGLAPDDVAELKRLGLRTPSCGWSAMCSSAPWSCG